MNMQHELWNLWFKVVWYKQPQNNQYKYWTSESVPRKCWKDILFGLSQ